MRALLCCALALGGCSQVLGIEDFEVSPPGIEGQIGLRLNSNSPQTQTDITPLDGVRVDWESADGASLSLGFLADGYYNVQMDELSPPERERGSLHFAVTEENLDVYVDLRRRVEFGQTFDVVIPVASERPAGIVLAALVRDQFGTPISDVVVELQDENDVMIAADTVYLDDEQLPDPLRGTTGGFGLVWFSGSEVVAGRAYQVYAQSGQTELTSRIITPADNSFHFLAAEAE